MLRDSSSEYEVGLIYIDSPGVSFGGQDDGLAAMDFLKILVEGKEVRLGSKVDVAYGRDVRLLYLGDMDVGLELVQNGHAWHYTYYVWIRRSSFYDLYKAAELSACCRRVGVQGNPEEPWWWRYWVKRGRR